MTEHAVNLEPLALRPLPLGSIHPTGWLRQQLRIQANGLSGHLDEFWPDVMDSGWIGGQADGWERGPYWLDGVIPLAFLLDDAALKAKVQRWVDYILAHQHPDGWLGPRQSRTDTREYKSLDPWPTFVMLKALVQFHDATGDPRIIPAVERCLRRVAALLAETPLSSWAQMRWADLLLSIYWLHDHTGAAWLLDLADTVHAQGYDWSGHFAAFAYPERMDSEQTSLATHVVNNAMAVKSPGVWYRRTRREADIRSVYRIIETLDAYHGQASGIFSGDEHYAGKNPSQGTELCAVNEYLFSLESLLAILGDPLLADRLERIAFNALPATFSPDMWAHQYDQQANQVLCEIAEDRIYVSNDPDSNIFGLEPNYGCCTANLSQGWPKFAAHLWMATPDAGLAAVAYAPCRLNARAGGQTVQVETVTNYPFEDTVRISVRCDAPARFPLLLRIPAWAEAAQVTAGDEPPLSAAPGRFQRIERVWQGETQITLRLPMAARVQRRFHGSVAIERGPLVFALRVGEDWRQVRGELPHADWEVYPTTPWNYALQLDVEQPERSLRVSTRPLGACPFSPDGAPLLMAVRGRRLPQWHIEHNAAGPLPQSPVSSTEPLAELTLIPYGCTNLRVTEFPLLGGNELAKTSEVLKTSEV